VSKTLAVIQARMGSTRLPGKVLEPIGPLPAIAHVYRRTILAVPDALVAIPNTPEDAPLFDYLVAHDIPLYQHDGPQEDVLARYAAVVRHYEPDRLVRITADCPFIDPVTIAKCVTECRQMQYVSNLEVRTFPRGLDVEVMDAKLILRADEEATDPHDREHVTPWIRRKAVLKHNVRLPQTFASFRWVLDTADDLTWFRSVADAISVTPPHPRPVELFDLIRRRPEYGRFEPRAA